MFSKSLRRYKMGRKEQGQFIRPEEGGAPTGVDAGQGPNQSGK